ncbi:MAG: CDGSH iron-sulfur domain-containing protein [Catenulispora sp.]
MSAAEPIRVVMAERTGPILVQGPVEVRLPDGRRVLSRRPMVALCACRRSRDYPFCDTSHRRHCAGGREE